MRGKEAAKATGIAGESNGTTRKALVASTAVLLVCSALLQGGFFPRGYLFFGAVFAALFAVFGRDVRLDSVHLGILALCTIYAISGIVNASGAGSLDHAFLPCSCLAFALFLSGLSACERRAVVREACIGGGVYATLALLALTEVVPVWGAVVAGRLQLGFQYANAAGIWLAALALAGRGGEDRMVVAARPVTVVALVLTRSLGAIGLFLVAELVCAARHRDETNWREELLLVDVSVILALAIALVPWAAAKLVVIALSLVVGWFWGDVAPGCVERRVHLWASASLAAGLVALVATGRVSQGLGTLAERFEQMRDAVAVIASYPLIGAGPNAWEGIYESLRTTDYVSTVVHASYLQVGVSTGVAGIAVAVCLAWLVARRARGAGAAPASACLVILAHGLLDFSLLFFSVDAMALLLALSGDECPAVAHSLRCGGVGRVCLGAGLCALCLGALVHVVMV